MADIIEGVHPTRMELLDINKRLALAGKGHKLLKEKRDSLMTEFLKRIDQARGPREGLEISMNAAYEDLIRAEALMSSNNVKAIALSTPESGSIDISYRSIVGVKTPKIEYSAAEASRDKYNLTFTSSKLDEACDDFEQALKQILDLVETEEVIRRLGGEIKKTKRRVNALEHIMIPRLGNTQRYIEMRLEEMERESFVRLKMVKMKKAKAV
jgi:V/A-type H+-transporting ATPase subunit D